LIQSRHREPEQSEGVAIQESVERRRLWIAASGFGLLAMTTPLERIWL
jgi:hypothetical protein